MEKFIGAALEQYGDSIVILVGVAFLYIKVNFLTSKIGDLQQDFKQHINFHLCQPKEKGD